MKRTLTPSGKFKTYARWLGVIEVIREASLESGITRAVLIVVGATQITNGLVQSIIMMYPPSPTLPIPTSATLNPFIRIAGVLIGILELPFCCTCINFCAAVALKMKVFEVYAFRGILYLGSATAVIVALTSVGSALGFASRRKFLETTMALLSSSSALLSCWTASATLSRISVGKSLRSRTSLLQGWGWIRTRSRRLLPRKRLESSNLTL